MEIITNTGERFDVTSGYNFDFEFINPLLSDVGSQSAPGTLPYTPRNLRLLEFPDRIDNVRRPRVKRTVTLREGSFQKIATQVLLKANPKERIVTTFYLDEAIFYERIKTVNMNEVNYGAPRQASVQELFTLCQDVAFKRRTDDFHVFPVISNYDINTSSDTLENVILNKVTYNETTGVASLLDQSLYGIVVDGTPVAVPFGYGIAPFLKVSFVIRKVAEHFGYTLVNNIFATDHSLKQLVLVNNVADSIVKGTLDYARLVPTCTVSEFVKTLQNKFGLRFLANEVARTITIATLDDRLTLPPDLDLTPHATERPRVDWADKQRLHLSSGTSIPGASPAVNSVDELTRVYGPVHFAYYSSNPGALEYNTLYYVYSENIFVVKVRMGPGSPPKIKRFSPYFDYTAPGEGELLDLAAPDEQLPVFRLHYLDPARGYEMAYLMPGIPETVLVNSTLVFSDDDKEQAEKKITIPIMFCFSLPSLQTAMSVPVGTTGAYDESGSGWGGNLALNYTWTNGIRNRKYVQYDLTLARSNHPVSCLLRLPLPRLQTLDLTTPKLLFHQPVLIERVKCRVGTGTFEVTETLFRTLKHYEEEA
ncbi:MAG: hypothetical protein LBP56_05230 [Odoribacteraceae bacterium]|jgi:hypothetical protein|nr:hypothetical protein [Odoribacteraceae bacterium]